MHPAGSVDIVRMSERLLSALETQRLIVTSALREQIRALFRSAGTLDHDRIAERVVSYVWLFGGDSAPQILVELDRVTQGVFGFAPRDRTIPITGEASIVVARTEAKRLAMKMGFRPVLQTKVATAASELSRNIYMYAGEGEIILQVRTTPRNGIAVIARDRGPGIADVQAVLAGQFQSRTGMGMGLRGVRSIADAFSIRSVPGEGTEVIAEFYRT